MCGAGESSRVHTKYAQGSRMESFINLKRKYDWATKIQITIETYSCEQDEL